MNKQLHRIQRTDERHWVGDGFPVKTLFWYGNLGHLVSPFLMLDHAGPHDFPATDKRLGVGAHPHRGFETVTIVYDGEVEHRDSAGGGGKIGKGDVQWMTAASGLVHEEFHGREYAARGGPFEMAQLWVNLPATDKMCKPRYQPVLANAIPEVSLVQGSIRVIAGEYQGTRGPVDTFTPMGVWDLRLQGEANTVIDIPDGWNALLVVLEGTAIVAGSTVVQDEVAIFERQGESIGIERAEGLKALVLAGEPIDEPVVGYGPFVMNTREEIEQAIRDYHTGKMGQISD